MDGTLWSFCGVQNMPDRGENLNPWKDCAWRRELVSMGTGRRACSTTVQSQASRIFCTLASWQWFVNASWNSCSVELALSRKVVSVPVLSRVYGSVTNDDGFWIGWLDLFTASNHNQVLTVHSKWLPKIRPILAVSQFFHCQLRNSTLLCPLCTDPTENTACIVEKAFLLRRCVAIDLLFRAFLLRGCV
jgi:hypothetical protein